jgi:hypothetical protein
MRRVLEAHIPNIAQQNLQMYRKVPGTLRFSNEPDFLTKVPGTYSFSKIRWATPLICTDQGWLG